MASRLRWQRPERLYDLLAPLARLVVWVLADLRVVGAERILSHGGVLQAANHVSLLDPLVLALALYDCGRRAALKAGQAVLVYPEGRSCRPARPAPPGPVPACLPCEPASIRCCRSPPTAWSAADDAACHRCGAG